MLRSLAITLLLLPTIAQAQDRPNIVFLIADDLGYGDLSCYGQARFQTPNIDRLARDGMKMGVHYAGSAVCASSRCALMTGKHSGHGFIRGNRQYRPDSEGQWPVPEGELTLPLTLKQLGYTTGAFGKWGLGAPGTSGEPLRQGIDRFFGYNCQAVAHNYYPTSLWDDRTAVVLDNPKFPAHQKLAAGADPSVPSSYAKFSGKDYAPDLIARQALRFLRENKDRPFFLFFPTTVPHLALQVPEDSLKEFEGKFPEEPYKGDRSYLPQRTPRAAYAAMVTRLDREIGRILDLLTELKLDEKTIVVFTSDNGPLYNKLGGTDTDFFKRAGDIVGGRVRSTKEACGCPAWSSGKVGLLPGSELTRVTGFEDWLPTLLELDLAKGIASPPAVMVSASHLPF